MTTGILGLLLGPVGTFSIFLNTRSPSTTRPESKRQGIKELEKRIFIFYVFSFVFKVS